MITRILSCFLPNQCQLCLEINNLRGCLCAICTKQLPFLPRPHCLCCASLIEQHASHCGACIKNKPYFDRIISPFSYTEPVKKYLTDYKFYGQLQYLKLCGQQLYEYLQTESTYAEAILAVPLHKKRLQQRGFNQSHELAKYLAKKMHLPLLTQAIIKTKVTQAQSALSAKNRKTNLNNCFRLSKPLNYERVALIDDVITTGTTLNQCAKLLKQNGVSYVEGWCIARTCYI